MDESGDRTLIPVEVVDAALRPHQLKTKQICRLCLTQEAPMSSIFALQGGNKSTTQPPVSLQIMACFSIEVYAEDGMPGMICDNCQVLLKYCYQFKQICKNADTQLKLFLTTGIWPEKLLMPKALLNLVQNTKVSQQKPSPRVNQKPDAFNVSPTVENEKGQKVNIIKLSPADVKNLKLGNRITMVNLDNTLAVGVQRDQSKVSVTTPMQTSTPLPKRGQPVNRQGSRLQLHEGANASPIQKPNEQQPQKKEVNSPIILNKLAPSNTCQNVKEEFVATGEGTVEMILNYEPEAVDVAKSGTIFPCTECSRTFKLKQLLDIHKLNHMRERKFPCGECDKRFFSKYDLAKHMATHTGARPYVCVICRAAFSRSTLLTRHQASHKADLTHPCSFCKRVFVSQEELSKHAQTHVKNRPFQCMMCSKSFAYKQGLDRHAAVHAEVLPHQCQYCEMSFHTSAMLSRHLTAHAGSRPYPCRLCNKSFLLSHHLSRHLRRHNASDQSEYTCNGCERGFSTRSELIEHSAQHAKENLACPMCQEAFYDESEVDEHMQQHATDQFACDYCDMMYTSEQKLAAHCQEAHENELAYEWSEEQQRQLIAEQEQALKEDVDGQDDTKEHSADNTQILIAGEEEDGNLLLECENDQQEDGNLFLDEEDQNTAVYVDQYGELVETFEVTEFVDVSPKAAVTPPQTIAKEKVPSPTKQPAAVKQEPAQTSPLATISRQKSTEEFYQRNKLAVEKKTSQRKVSDMLKRLPKGVTIKREHTNPSLTINVPSKPSQPVAEKKQPEVTIQKTKAVNQGPPKGGSPVEVEKRKPGRPPKAKEENEGKKENVTTAKKAKQEESKEERKLTKPGGESKKELPEKKLTMEGGLKRSGTMNFPKSRVGIDGPTKPLADAATAAAPASAKRPMQMVRRSYAMAPTKGSAVGIKRPAEKESPDEAAIPSKRPVPPPPTTNRKTLNPAMLSSMGNTKQKTAATPVAGGGAKAPVATQVNVSRTIKRVPNADAAPVGTAVEMNVGGQTIKMQKLMLTKDEALALQKSGKLIAKVKAGV
uniref:Protein krueppel n=1 Tax=Anopheles atroparvus TaxID=41427 RepID=A0AAG5D822_ANOAO